MKTPLQIRTSALALAALLAGAAGSHATNLAELPLRASVLAKPNVIFGYDDSGSMDFEVMLDSNTGHIYWDYANGRGKLAGRPIQTFGTGIWEMFYLFPNGVAAGARQYTDPDASYSYAIGPAPESAWLRSSHHNRLYYNPAVTYMPWAPAYVGGAVMGFAAADPAAARSHPVNGTGTFRLDATMNRSDADWRFTYLGGMTIPAGATVHSCTVAVGALPATVPNGGRCMVSVPYYPATYWQREACVVDNVSCALGPDDLSIRRYEIKPGNTFPSGRGYTAEMQNFANWFTYYRKRRLMAGAAMGEVLENLSGLRMGVVFFNDRQSVTMYDSDAAAASSNRLRVAGMFYTPERNAGTPTRETLNYIGQQYQRTDLDTQGNNIIQYACQRNNAFIVTDGFANASRVTVPGYSQATYGANAPYATTHAGTLADLALAYYTRNPRSDLASGKVPLDDAGKTNADRNPNLHMNTYAVTLGLTGFQWPAAPDPFVTAPTWAMPSTQDRNQIDDLWHATLNGRGKKYLATTPRETTIAIQAGLTEILNFQGAQSGVAVSTANLQRGDGKAYMATYNPAGWSGDLQAAALDAATGAVSSTPAWSAAGLLNARDWTTRVIATSSGTAGVGFTTASVGVVVNPGGIYGNTGDVINYLRGERSREGAEFRLRTSRMGAVINAEPVVVDGVAYVASGEGMLHAFDTVGAAAGQELWAFVPRAVLPKLGATTQRGWAFRTQLDGTPAVGEFALGQKLLVAGMGVAGRSYYALDVTTPRGLTEAGLAAKVKWEFPAMGDAARAAKVGQSVGRPLIVNTASQGRVVLITSGYNSTADGKGRLFMLNADTGAVIKEFTVADGSLANESGLSQVSPYAEASGFVRYVYGGDLLGSVWRFDLEDASATPAAYKLAVLKSAAGELQPVTAAPELVEVAGKRVVVVGTGRILDITDFGNTRLQSLYAIADGSTLANARSGLVQQTYSRTSDTLTNSAVNWNTGRGWYVDLGAGEHINTRPMAAHGALGFVTNLNGASDCSASSYFYWVNLGTGSQVPGTTTVSTLLSDSVNAARTAAVLSSQGLRFINRKADGSNAPTPPLPPVNIPPGKNAWREVRR